MNSRSARSSFFVNRSTPAPNRKGQFTSQNGRLANSTFGYFWHVLAAFGTNRGRMSSRNQTTGHVIGKADWVSNTSVYCHHSIYCLDLYEPSEHLAVLGPQSHVLPLCRPHFHRETRSCMHAKQPNEKYNYRIIS